MTEQLNRTEDSQGETTHVNHNKHHKLKRIHKERFSFWLDVMNNNCDNNLFGEDSHMLKIHISHPLHRRDDNACLPLPPLAACSFSLASAGRGLLPDLLQSALIAYRCSREVTFQSPSSFPCCSPPPPLSAPLFLPILFHLLSWDRASQSKVANLFSGSIRFTTEFFSFCVFIAVIISNINVTMFQPTWMATS